MTTAVLAMDGLVLICWDISENEAREIRTPDLLIWSQPRYRCAIAPVVLKSIAYMLDRQTSHLKCQRVHVVIGSLIHSSSTHDRIAEANAQPGEVLLGQGARSRT